MTKQIYTIAEIEEVVKKVCAGQHLTTACTELGFVYFSIRQQIVRLGIAHRIQREKRSARRRNGVDRRPQPGAGSSPPVVSVTNRKQKVRSRCCTCGVQLLTGSTWAYCSKGCEINRPAAVQRSRPDRSCANCDAFCVGSPTSSYRFGTCRRYAPDVQWEGGWPKVKVADWCLEWRPRAAAASPEAAQ